MKDACAGQSDCSSSGSAGFQSGPERRSTTRNVATFAFYHTDGLPNPGGRLVRM